MAERPAPVRRRGALGSIRLRITAAATVLVAAVLVVAGVASVQTQRRALTDRADEQLEQRADEIDGLVQRGSVGDALAVEGADETLTQVVTPRGEVVAESANLDGAPPVADAPSSRQRFSTVSDVPIDDDEFRVLSRRISTPDGPAVLHVALDFDDVTESVAVLTRTLTILFPILLVIVAALVWVVVARALRPVEAMRAEVERITADDLDRRVPVPPTSDEINRLARTMNAMLDRVEDAYRRQQRFVADASHELRSPLTGIRSELEVDGAHPDQADLVATHRSVLEETVRLQRLVDDLLFLARRDDGTQPMRTGPVDVDDLVLREASALKVRRGVAVDTTLVSGAQVVGHADELARGVRNLLENAARYARTRVTVALAEGASEIVLTVDDDGPGVPEHQAEEIFERFARVDEARTRDSGGAGLGLAITRDVVARHGGTVVLDSTATVGARFTARIPLDQSGAAGRPAGGGA